MYECVNVIYGVVVDDYLYEKISNKMSKIDPDWSSFRDDNLESLGFNSKYHGNGPTPFYFGVGVDSWACYSPREFVNYEVTDKLKNQYQQKLEEIVGKWPDMLEFLDTPKLMYYGSSS